MVAILCFLLLLRLVAVVGVLIGLLQLLRMALLAGLVVAVVQTTKMEHKVRVVQEILRQQIHLKVMPVGMVVP
jgi:hypothetical protein